MWGHLRSCSIQLPRGADEPTSENLKVNTGFLRDAESVAMTFRKEMYLQRPGRSSAREGILQREAMKLTPQIVTLKVSLERIKSSSYRHTRASLSLQVSPDPSLI